MSNKDNKQTKLPGQIELEEVLEEKLPLRELRKDIARIHGQLRERYQSIDSRLTKMTLEAWSSADSQRLQRLADNLFTASLQLEDALEVISRAQTI